MKEMKLLCWNVNGLRAVANKGFLDWLNKEKPDILCLNETKAQPEQLDQALREPEGYHVSLEQPGEEGLRRRGHFHPGEAPAGGEGLLQSGAEVRRRGKAHPDRVPRLRPVEHLLPQRQEGRDPAEVQDGFLRGVPALSRSRSGRSNPTSSSAAISTRRTRRSTWPGRRRTRRSPGSCPWKGPGWTSSWPAATWTRSGSSTRSPASIPGGT